jgi:hypothetical protein
VAAAVTERVVVREAEVSPAPVMVTRYSAPLSPVVRAGVV